MRLACLHATRARVARFEDRELSMTLRTLFAAGASALALTVSVPALADDAPATAPAATTPAPAPLPTMTFGTWGFDPAAIDKSIDPGDDFFAYANAKWLKANPLPP